MKVLHIINSLDIGGAEKLLVDIIPIMNSINGYNVDVLLLKHTDTFLSRSLKSKGINVFMLNTVSIYSPINLFKLLPFFRKYEIIHVHLFPALYWAALAKLALFSKMKLIFTEHSTLNRRWKSRFFRILDSIIYAQYAAVTCITEQVRIALSANVAKVANKIQVIENGINLFTYQYADAYNLEQLDPSISKDDKIIIQVSAFRHEKDQDTLIRAVSQLPANYKLILVGDGDRKTLCKNLVHQLNINDKVFFLGNRSDVPRLLKTSFIAVQSSHWEGFGLASVEAMASGLPTLVSNVQGLANVVGNKKLVFEPGDDKQLAEKIISLALDQNLYSEAKAYCVNRATKFDINLAVAKLIQLYSGLLNK